MDRVPRYIGAEDFVHGTAERLGVLLVNLGTPDAPTARAVRPYLAQFLWDPRVIELPRPLWWLVLHAVILRVRPARTAKAYRKIWTEEGSPLLVHSKRQLKALHAALSQRCPGPVKIALGMSYGSPSISDALTSLRKSNVRRLLILPLYPQYSATTTGSVFDAVTSELRRWRWLPEMRFVVQYHDHPGYIGALAGSIREHWEEHGRGEHLLFSFHGLPRRCLAAGDLYHCQCHKTARLVAEALELDMSSWSLSFQSRVGREEWLRPYTDETLRRFAAQGPRNVDVVCPGFTVDCLETLEEIVQQNTEMFRGAGGEALNYVPALNDREKHIEFLADLVLEHAGGWPEASAAWNAADAMEAAKNTSRRAHAHGAEK